MGFRTLGRDALCCWYNPWRDRQLRAAALRRVGVIIFPSCSEIWTAYHRIPHRHLKSSHSFLPPSSACWLLSSKISINRWHESYSALNMTFSKSIQNQSKQERLKGTIISHASLIRGISFPVGHQNPCACMSLVRTTARTKSRFAIKEDRSTAIDWVDWVGTGPGTMAHMQWGLEGGSHMKGRKGCSYGIHLRLLCSGFFTGSWFWGKFVKVNILKPRFLYLKIGIIKKSE